MARSLLIADDELENRLVLGEAFTRQGYRVHLASNGAEALKLAAPRISLGIFDFRMPRMSGLEVLRELREREIDFPVLFLTSHADAGDQEKALELGALGIFEKPIDLSVLKRFVIDLVGEERSVIIRTTSTSLIINRRKHDG